MKLKKADSENTHLDKDLFKKVLQYTNNKRSSHWMAEQVQIDSFWLEITQTL